MSVERRTLNERAERKPRKESVGRAKGENETRRISWKELKNELEGSQAAERHRILTVVSLNGCGREENLESDS